MCDFCHGMYKRVKTNSQHWDSKYVSLRIQIEDGKLEITKKDCRSVFSNILGDVEIEFCPMCGNKVKKIKLKENTNDKN